MSEISRISIHALRKESDISAKGAYGGITNISIHALRKESDDTPADIVTFFTISIHALRKESDYCLASRTGYGSDFNPRSP